jgi:hypothetical protein
MKPNRIVAVFALYLVLGTALLGCGRGGRFAPVSGTVTLDEKPLADAYLIFQPVNGAPDQISQGQTDATGAYTLAGVDGREGALVGPHQVRITTIPPNAMEDERSPLPKDRVPAKYQYEPLTYDVPDVGTDAADFVLSRR